MARLPDNPGQEDPPSRPSTYSMFAQDQCPKVLAWMTAFSAAVGNALDAETWLVELIGAIVTARSRRTPALQS